MAKGAFFLVIGLVAFRFGTAYASAWYAHEGSIPGFAWIAMVIGALFVIAGIRDCIIGTTRSRGLD